MNSGTTAVRAISSKSDLDKFIRLPWNIYKNNSNWVPPLIKDVKFKLNREKHPFFENARMQLFLAENSNGIVGRIAAVINERHNEFHDEKQGFFGMFECIDDTETAGLLFNAAEEWCRNEGMNKILGPVNLSTNDECGFLLEGFDLDPAIMMPYTHEYYLRLSEDNGYKKAKDLYGYLKDEVGVVNRISKLVERVKKKEDVVVRPINMKDFDNEVEIIKDIYNSAWEVNWGFVPMTPSEMDLMAKELKPICEPELVLFAEVKGEPVGVSITLPDFNYVLKKLNGKLGPIEILKFFYYKRKIVGLRSVIFGLKKDFRRTGINVVLYYETEIRAARIGYKWCEMSWNLEDNDLINRFDEAVGGKLYKKYRLYEKNL